MPSPQLTREEIIARYKKAALQKRQQQRRRRQSQPIRAKVRKTVNMFVDTSAEQIDVKREFTKVLMSIRDEREAWKQQPGLTKVVPYKKDASTGLLRENEFGVVAWVTLGIHPYTKIRYGPSAGRSAFDYMTNEQLDQAIRLHI